MALGLKCAVHWHGSGVPMEIHHIWPKGDGGPDIKSNKVVVCSNGHGEIHGMLDQIRKYGSLGKVPWKIRRLYGFRVRRYASQGWEQIKASKEGLTTIP